MASKWTVFRERAVDRPMWVVWDEFLGEFLFATGSEALTFVDAELRKRQLAERIRERQDGFNA